ncbi:hypothetical protein [Flavivirga algicola]|uniref:MotA/TolQ/ExbB proton channel domain-containing protein n=1 Tax=Flavivirga algicola TaxID=2729136 RepID=A0ABX1S0S6_9FLAO|nr:hypothetical protein [Flavivirga algicola]NMH89475.1 hypothetical protein [Flavivirga algicola]
MDELTVANDFFNSAIIGTIFSGISHILLLIGSIIILNKQKTTASFLILLGAIFMILTSLIGILWPVLSQGNYEKVLEVQGIISIISGLSYFIFALGILLFAVQLIKKELS